MARLRCAISCTSGTLRLLGPVRCSIRRPRSAIACLPSTSFMVPGSRLATPRTDPMPCRKAPRSARTLVAIPERQGVDPSIGPPQPSPHRSAVDGKSVAKQDPVRCQSGAIRSPIRDDDPGRHGQWFPAPTPSDLNAEPSPLIHPADEFVDIDDVGLELDDHERSMSRVPGEDVDDPSLAVDRKCDLRFESPSREIAGEPAGYRLVKARVSAADEPIEISATRASAQRHLDVENASDGEDGPKLDALDVSALDPGDHRRAEPDFPADIGLSPSPADPDRTESR